MDYNNIEVIALTKQLVSIPSTNPGTYEKEIGDFIFDWFVRETGVEVVRDEFAPGRFNVVATLKGEIDDPAFVCINHMDVVPVGSGWTRDPWKAEIVDGKMYGRGTADMKSGLAAGMIAFRDIVKMGKKPKHTLRFIASADEEGNIMTGAIQALRSGYITEKSWVLDLEPSLGEIWGAHKGKTWFEITTKGTPAHGSMPWTGADAITAMAEVVTEIRTRIEALPEDEYFGISSVCFGTIKGGRSTNIVCDEVDLTIDMRLAPPLTTDASIKLVEDSIEAGTARIKGTTGSYKIIAQKPFVKLDENSILLKKLQKAIKEVTGSEAPTPVFTGYTDSGVVTAETGNVNCMSYGPKGGNYHQDDEWVDCESVLTVLEVCKKTIIDMIF